MHRIAAGAALVTHVVFVVLAVAGGFIAWLVPVVLIPHLAAAAWGGRMATTRARCPLSTIENWGRAGSGREPLHERGFIAHYAEGRLYPTTWTKRVELLAVALVAGSWLGLAMR